MVPEGWSIDAVGDLFDVQLGKMLNKKAKEKYPQYEYLTNVNVRWGDFNLQNLNQMHFSDRERLKYGLRCGDVIVCEGGEVGRCAVWGEDKRDILFQKALHRVRSRGTIDPHYFQNYLEFVSGTKLLDDHTTRTSIAHLTREKFLRLPVRYPSLPEQRKIAEILSTWDKVIAANEKLLKNSQRQKAALARMLLTGERRLKGFAEPWLVTTLESLTKRIIGGGTPKRHVASYWGGDIPWITVKDLVSDYIDHGMDWITESGLRDSSAELVPASSIILATRMAVGKVVLARRPVAINQDLKALELKSGVLPRFLFQQLLVRAPTLQRISTGSTVKGIRLDSLRKLELCIPPTEEEQAAVERVLTNAQGQIDHIQARGTSLKREKTVLIQQLLTGKKRIRVEPS